MEFWRSVITEKIDDDSGSKSDKYDWMQKIVSEYKSERNRQVQNLLSELKNRIKNFEAMLTDFGSEKIATKPENVINQFFRDELKLNDQYQGDALDLLDLDNIRKKLIGLTYPSAEWIDFDWIYKKYFTKADQKDQENRNHAIDGLDKLYGLPIKKFINNPLGKNLEAELNSEYCMHCCGCDV